MVPLLLFLLFYFACYASIIPMDKIASGGSARCNDGTPYFFYFRASVFNNTKNWLLYLQGGAFCFDSYSCAQRYKDAKFLMSSDGDPDTISTGQILSDQQEDNPLFYDWNQVYLRYCTSDSFCGNASSSSTPWSFLGAHVVPDVVAKLKTMGLSDAPDTTVFFTG